MSSEFMDFFLFSANFFRIYGFFLILKHLKVNKSHDPNGLANILLKPEVAGTDLKEALLLMFNSIKKELIYPDAFEDCDITTIFKKKDL